MTNKPTPEDRDAAADLADHIAADELLGRWTARWTAPTEERVPIEIHPIVRTELRALLMGDPNLRGVGYSEFIMRAIRQWEVDHA